VTQKIPNSKLVPAYREWLKATGIRVGDKVKVIANEAPMWEGTWIEDEMYAGQQGTVVRLGDDNYVSLCLSTGWWYPYWVLVKVEDDDVG